jgi:spermidine synthase
VRAQNGNVQEGKMSGDYVAHAISKRGEVFLLRRASDGALELRVNGIFVMDTVHTSTERLLATTTLDTRALTSDANVLIGGLGLGFTLREVLSDRRVATVHVAEIEPAVVEWHRQGLIPDTVDAFRDSRVHISVADVRNVLAGLPGSSLDVILLDIDNGPGFLVYDTNVAVYRRDFLALCREKVSPHGIVAIWSADASPALAAAMRQVFAHAEVVPIPVILGNTETTYTLFIARR